MMELLAPAGAMPQLKSALNFGADAVYGGFESYGLRASAGNFTQNEMKEALALTHAAGARFYVTLNILPFDDELPGLISAARLAYELGADGAIVADAGAFLKIRESVPGLPLHVSTQANVMNAATALLFASLGAKRIVPARELSLERLRALRDALPENVEIEAFVHGAMCMAYSGRCVMSDHLTGRGGNRGECAQPCRWHYSVVEEKRPDQAIGVETNERGTAIFSAFDLNMLSYLPQLRAAGVASLKIEGRMKTAYYVASVVSCYRRALDLLEKEGEAAYLSALPALQADLAKASHRASNTGFYFGAPTPACGADAFSQTMEYVADVTGYQNGCACLTLKNRFFVGDTLEMLTKEGGKPFSVTAIIDEATGDSLPTVSVAGQRLLVPCPFKAENGDFVRGPNRNHL